jgi:hypothetical protein
LVACSPFRTLGRRARPRTTAFEPLPRPGPRRPLAVATADRVTRPTATSS